MVTDLLSAARLVLAQLDGAHMVCSGDEPAYLLRIAVQAAEIRTLSEQLDARTAEVQALRIGVEVQARMLVEAQDAIRAHEAREQRLKVQLAEHTTQQTAVNGTHS